MRTGSLGLLVLLMAGAFGADARAQSAAPAANGKEDTAKKKAPAAVAADNPSVIPPSAASCPVPGQPGAYPSWPGHEWPVMPQAEGPGAAGQTPAGQQGTTDGSTGQAQQQPQQQQQQQQANDPAAQREAELAALRRDHYGPNEGMWFGAGPLLWWMKKAPTPGPLVTTGVGGQGILGQSDTRTLFGDNRFDFDRFFGFQARGGTWLNCLHNWGIEFGGFVFEQRSINAGFASGAGGNPLLARPFFNAVTARPESFVVAVPANLTGNVTVHADSQFWGGDITFIRNLASCEDWNFELLAGFRYLDLAENLRVASSSQVLPGGVLPPTLSTALTNPSVTDRFFTRNQFYGGEVGGRFERWMGPYFVSLLGRVSLGPNHESIKTFGFTRGQAANGTIVTRPGGLLAVSDIAIPNLTVTVPPGMPIPQTLLRGNNGRTTTDWFEVVPEVGVQFGMQVTNAIRVSAGYDFLFMNSVARPGSQVNGNINLALVPSSSVFGSTSGPGRPLVSSRQETFFAHGLVLNLEFRY